MFFFKRKENLNFWTLAPVCFLCLPSVVLLTDAQSVSEVHHKVCKHEENENEASQQLFIWFSVSSKIQWWKATEDEQLKGIEVPLPFCRTYCNQSLNYLNPGETSSCGSWEYLQEDYLSESPDAPHYLHLLKNNPAPKVLLRPQAMVPEGK